MALFSMLALSDMIISNLFFKSKLRSLHYRLLKIACHDYYYQNTLPRDAREQNLMNGPCSVQPTIC